MALNTKDYKRELQKALKNKKLVESAFTLSDTFLETQAINVPQQIEKNKKLFKEFSENYEHYFTTQQAQSKKDTYLKWYEDTLLNESSYLSYVDEMLATNKKNKEEILELFDTTDYGKAVRDLVNDKKDFLVYDIFSKIDKTGVLGTIYETALVNIGADLNDKIIFTCTYGVTTDSEYYEKMQDSEIFKSKDQDYKDLIKLICTINEKLRNKREQDNKTAFTKYKAIQLTLDYGERATITETPLINNLAVTPLENMGGMSLADKETFKQLNLLNKYNFNLDENSIKESQEKINKLNELDRFVLDTIVLDFYTKKNKRIFSDRQIAEWYTQKGGRDKVSENIQKEINNSILKLQNTRIDLDYASVQQLKNKHVKVKAKNPLIWLKSVEVKEETTSNFYEIIDVPFYFTYLNQTNSNMINYNRGLLYLDIDGVDKSLPNQNLKHYLIRRLAVFEKMTSLDELYIDIGDIYNVQNATAEYYPNYNNLKKARQRAREHTEIMLNELKREYNFTFRKNESSKGIKGYLIKPKKERL